MCCRVAKRVGRNYLALREGDWRKRAVFLVDPDLQAPYDISRLALLTYAVYMAVHILRFTRPATETEAYHLISSLLGHGAQGDPRAMAILDGAMSQAHAPPAPGSAPVRRVATPRGLRGNGSAAPSSTTVPP